MLTICSFYYFTSQYYSSFILLSHIPAAGVGLGLIRSTGDLVRMLSGSWARRLRVKEEKAQDILTAVNDRETDDLTR